MTEQPTTPPTEAAPAPQPAPQPQIDAKALAESTARAAAEAAGKIAEQKAIEIAEARLKSVFRAAAGEPEVDPKERFLKAFVDTPDRVLQAHKEQVKKEVMDEINAVENIKRTQRSVMTPIFNEYPELQSDKRIKYIERLAEDYESSGKTYAESLELAAKDAVKEFGAKSVSEAQRAGTYQYGLPRGGGAPLGAPVKSAEQSNTDFLSGMRSKAAAYRNRTS